MSLLLKLEDVEVRKIMLTLDHTFILPCRSVLKNHVHLSSNKSHSILFKVTQDDNPAPFFSKVTDFLCFQHGN